MELKKLPIESKVKITNQIISDWYENHEGRVFVAFSGGFKSSLLLYFVRKMYPEVPAVFVDNELEYPEIKRFAITTSNTEVIYPKRKYQEVIEKFGYQVISKEVSENVASYRNTGSEKALRMLKGILRNGKPNLFSKHDFSYLIDAPFKISRQCCLQMKHQPLQTYASKNKLAMFKGNTSSRAVNILSTSELRSFCNRYKDSYYLSHSYPLYFWLPSEILGYLYRHQIRHPTYRGEIYYDKYSHLYMTREKGERGCLLCLCNLDKYDREKKFVKMKEKYPEYYSRAFMYHHYGKVCDFLGYKY